MNYKILFCSFIVLGCSPSFAFHSGLQGVDGETIFDKQFIADYERARVQLEQRGSLEPMLGLLQKYTRPAERAELELSIGIAYGQRTGLVDPAKSIEYLTNAARHNLPEKTSLQILMWRGNSYEQLKKYKEALQDYLRGLVQCSYYDLSRGWPEIEKPPQPIYTNSSDPENEIRIREYNAYRYKTDFIRFLLRQRYYLIDAVRRIQKDGAIDDNTVLGTIGKLTPDSYAVEKVRKSLAEENRRPWP